MDQLTKKIFMILMMTILSITSLQIRSRDITDGDNINAYVFLALQSILIISVILVIKIFIECIKWIFFNRDKRETEYESTQNNADLTNSSERERRLFDQYIQDYKNREKNIEMELLGAKRINDQIIIRVEVHESLFSEENTKMILYDIWHIHDIFYRMCGRITSIVPYKLYNWNLMFNKILYPIILKFFVYRYNSIYSINIEELYRNQEKINSDDRKERNTDKENIRKYEIIPYKPNLNMKNYCINNEDKLRSKEQNNQHINIKDSVYIQVDDEEIDNRIIIDKTTGTNNSEIKIGQQIESNFFNNSEICTEYDKNKEIISESYNELGLKNAVDNEIPTQANNRRFSIRTFYSYLSNINWMNLIRLNFTAIFLILTMILNIKQRSNRNPMMMKNLSILPIALLEKSIFKRRISKIQIASLVILSAGILLSSVRDFAHIDIFYTLSQIITKTLYNISLRYYLNNAKKNDLDILIGIHLLSAPYSILLSFLDNQSIFKMNFLDLLMKSGFNFFSGLTKIYCIRISSATTAIYIQSALKIVVSLFYKEESLCLNLLTAVLVSLSSLFYIKIFINE